MRKLLLIDDDAELCAELAETFREEGYLVDSTSDSAEGSVLIKKNNYDVAVFDYKMRGLNGIDLLKLAKGLNPACAVFLVSGRAGIETLAKEERVSDLVAGIITKPFDVDELLRKIKTAVEAGAG
ncbi:MAG: response regulator [Elusimicrobia bacterium]|nr:response regulator [Elusimicrobiota bacterium]